MTLEVRTCTFAKHTIMIITRCGAAERTLAAWEDTNLLLGLRQDFLNTFSQSGYAVRLGDYGCHDRE